MKGGFDTHCLVLKNLDGNKLAILHWQGVKADVLESRVKKALVEWSERSLDGTNFVAKHGVNLTLEELAPLLPGERGSLNVILGNNNVHDLEVELVEFAALSRWRLDSPLVEASTAVKAQVAVAVRRHQAEMAGLVPPEESSPV